MDDKHLVLIVSAGRTGTKFLGDLLDSVIEDSFSAHEPDVFEGFTLGTWERVREFGFWHMVPGRLTGRTGIRNLTRQHLSGRIDLEGLAEQIERHRGEYYASRDAGLIIESYSQWYGILPAVEEVFSRYRVVGIVRDPRPWVESSLARGTRHGRRDLVRRFGQRRLDPVMTGDEEYADRWGCMSAFAKNCWYWRTVYGLIGEWVARDEKSRLYAFRDLFLGDDRAGTFREMLDFMTAYPDRRYGYDFDPAILDVRKNRSQEGSPEEIAESWRSWPRERARELDEICGDLMRELGYGREPAWSRLVGTG